MGTVYGSRVYYHCHPGYHYYYPPYAKYYMTFYRTCQHTGVWQSPINCTSKLISIRNYHDAMLFMIIYKYHFLEGKLWGLQPPVNFFKKMEINVMIQCNALVLKRRI